MWRSLWCVHREFSYESTGEIILKIGPQLQKLLSNIKGLTFLGHSVVVKRFSSFSKKHRILSRQICVRQTVRLTTVFRNWCRNACTLYKTPVRDTSDLKQRGASLTHGQAYRPTSPMKLLVNQWRKRLRARMKGKGHHVEPGYFQRQQQSTEENTFFRVISTATI